MIKILILISTVELMQVSVLFPVSPVCVTLSTTLRGCWRRCLSIASLTEQCRYATSLRWNKFPHSTSYHILPHTDMCKRLM